MWTHFLFAKSEPSLETQFRKAYEHAVRLHSLYSGVESSLWKRYTIELRESSLESPEEGRERAKLKEAVGQLFGAVSGLGTGVHHYIWSMRVEYNCVTHNKPLKGISVRGEAKETVKFFLPGTEEDPECLYERDNPWFYELLDYSDDQLVAWDESISDGTAWKQSKAQRRQGRNWSLLDDYLYNIEMNIGRLRWWEPALLW